MFTILGYVYTYFILLCLVESDIPDVTLLIEKPNYSSYYNAICVVKNSDSALSWGINSKENNKAIDVSEFIPSQNTNYFCNINSVNSCNSYWVPQNWMIGTSYLQDLDPVFDYRWEVFPTISTDGGDSFTLHGESMTNTFKIHISIKAFSDANIYLCTDNYPPKTSCYWITLGGWGGTKSTLRKCKKKHVPKKGYPEENGKDCKLRVFESEVNHTKYLDGNNWNHFTLEKTSKQIVLKAIKNNATLVNYTIDDDFILVKYLNIRTGQSKKGLWKFHDYEYTFTTEVDKLWWIGPNILIPEPQLCISFFLAMCRNCVLTVYIYNTDTKSPISSKNLTTTGGPKRWKLVKIVQDLPYSVNQTSSIQLEVSTSCNPKCTSPFWAIDYIRICSPKEVRIIKTEEYHRYNVACRVIDQSNVSLTLMDTGTLDTINSEKSCPVKTFGRSCINCSTVLSQDNDYCKDNIICELISEGNQICRCAEGFRGYTCRETCLDGQYGLNCQETCGECFEKPCNHVTGLCKSSTCLPDFTGLRCKQTKYPVLLQPPTVFNIGYTKFEVKISSNSSSDSSITWSGANSPAMFKLRYKEIRHQEWIESESVNYGIEQTIPVYDVKANTSYNVQIILIASDGNSYTDIKVPTTLVMTTCAFIKKDDISITTFNISAVILFEKINDDSCKIENYQIIIQNGVSNIISPSKMEITKLKPYTNYSVNIISRNLNKSLSIEFKTEEGVASQVKDFIVSEKGSTSIALSWNPPETPNGDIRRYNIIYEHVNYLGCRNLQNANQGSEKTIFETFTKTIINKLLPYSNYSFKISAVTTVDGEFKEIQGATSETEIPEQYELPSVKNITSQSTTAVVALEQSNCTLIKGEMEYLCQVICSNAWCSGESINKTFQSFYISARLENLLPYSNYSLNLKAKRKNGNVLTDSGRTFNFTTNPDVPHSVAKAVIFSKTQTELYLRLNPASPPRGELESYQIEIFLWRSFSTITIYPFQCPIWKNLHCVFLTDLRPNTEYTLQIKAKNKNVEGWSNSVRVVAQTIESASLAPENISFLWDNRYSLFLTWNHPDITNGPLKKFDIDIVKRTTHTTNSASLRCFIDTYNVEEERYNYTFNSSITFQSEECYSSSLIVYIIPINSVYGNQGYIEIDSPPRTPFFSKEPFVESLSNTTIILKIPQPKNLSDISYMYILMADAELPRRDQTIWRYLKARTHFELIPELIANINLTNVTPSSKFIIGNNASNISSNYHVKSINSGTNYTIKIILLNTYKNFTRFTTYTLEATTTGQKKRIEVVDSPNYAVLSCLLLLLIPLIFWIYIRKRKDKIVSWISSKRRSARTRAQTRANPDVIPLSKNIEYAKSQHRQVKREPPHKKREPPQVKREPLQPSGESNRVKRESRQMRLDIPLKQVKLKHIEPVKKDLPSPSHKSQHSMLINVRDFEKYVQRAVINEELEKQYQLFPRGQTKPWECGALPQNKSKNRYNNLIAYDHSRVKLEKLGEDPCSDYINASYIDGYRTRNAYIATQGPKIATVNDFWRMIWQENVACIVMLANITEGGKKKTEQYWPNINENVQYGDIIVEYVSTKVYADYHRRIFLVTNNGIERKVEQLHFVSWPDHGVPLYSQSLVPLLRELLNTSYGVSPIVVHCSAGVGRTGTIILCDICLRMAISEECIDVLKYQHKLREQRANLVDNLEQYKLVHMLLIEYLINPNTVINCDENMERAILLLLQSEEYEKQLNNITQRAWQDQALRTIMTSTISSAASSKNRFQDIVPGGHGRVYLSRYPATDEHSDYINGVQVDGFKAPEKFIVTQQPLPHTICDFWRMVDEKEVDTIISLNKIDHDKKDSCIFWPTNTVKEIQPVPYLTVEFLERSSNEFFSITKIVLHNEKNKKQSKRNIQLINFKRWLAKNLLPDSTESLLQLWEETERSSGGKAPIVISCYNGARASGLFVAFMFVLEKIKLEQECDVCLAVRSVRLNRMQFIENTEQFAFLYQAAMAYMSSFELYSNFI